MRNQETPFINPEAETNKRLAKERMQAVGLDLVRSAGFAARRTPTPFFGRERRSATGVLQGKDGDQEYQVRVVDLKPDEKKGGHSYDLQSDVNFTFELGTKPGQEIHHWPGMQQPDVYLPISQVGDFREQVIARIERLGRPEREGPEERIRARTVKKSHDTVYNMPVDKLRETRTEWMVDDLKRLVEHELKKHVGYQEGMMTFSADSKSDGSGSFRLDVSEGFEELGKKKYVLGVEWSLVDSTISVIDPETGSKEKFGFNEVLGTGDAVGKIIAKLGSKETK